MAAPTPQELQIIPKFRSNLKDLNLQGFLYSDLGLLQWLRARELKLDQAEAMLRKSLKWREDNDMDNILTWKAPTDLSTLCPVELYNNDKENCPVCFIPFGTWEGRKLVNMGHKEDTVKYIMQMFDKLKLKGQDRLTPSGQPVTQYLMIVNAKGLSLQTLSCIGAINMYMDALRSMEANYPETIRKIIVVNASRIFTAFFNLVKPIMSQRTFGKIDIYNTNTETWMAALQKEMELNQIPPVLISQWKLSKSFKGSQSSLASDDSAASYIEVTVGSGQKFPVEFDIKKPACVLSWSFTTVDHEIGFRLTVSHKTMENEILVPYSSVNSHLEPQEGAQICEKAGVYTFLFDNSNAKKPRVLKYRIDVAEAEDV